MPAKKSLEQYLRESVKIGKCRIHPASGAARKTYILRHGSLRRDQYVCHKCDNPKCIADYHHFVGSQYDNMQDAKRKGRTRLGMKHSEIAKQRMRAKKTLEVRERMSTLMRGRTLSAETRQKLSEKMKGTAHAKGSIRSSEFRLKISKARTGKKASASAKLNMSLAHTGKIHSAETRAKMSITAKAYSADPAYREALSLRTKKWWDSPAGQNLKLKRRAARENA